jgi:hypothetical protein
MSKKRPSYMTSVYPPIAWLVVFFAAIVAMGVHFFVAWVASAIITPILLIVDLAGMRYYWSVPIRRAKFYEDHFELTGRKLSVTKTYTDISAVTKIRKGSVYSASTRVKILVRGEPEDFIIPANPRRGIRGRDLYSWLLTKAKTQDPPR